MINRLKAYYLFVIIDWIIFLYTLQIGINIKFNYCFLLNKIKIILPFSIEWKFIYYAFLILLLIYIITGHYNFVYLLILLQILYHYPFLIS